MGEQEGGYERTNKCREVAIKITVAFEKVLLYRLYAKKCEIRRGRIKLQAHFQILHYGKYTDYSLE
jgi:hypothetical protein